MLDRIRARVNDGKYVGVRTVWVALDAHVGSYRAAVRQHDTNFDRAARPILGNQRYRKADFLPRLPARDGYR